MTDPQDSIWWKLVHLDPALFRGLVIAVITVLGAFGILISPDLTDSLVGVLVAGMAVVQALWTRAGVTANARVAVVVPDPVNAPNTVAPGEAATSAPVEEIIEAARTSGS